MFSTYPYPKITVEKLSYGPDTAINGPGPYIEYSGWLITIEALGLIKLSIMAPFCFHRALSTVVANDVYRLSMINVSGGVSIPTFPSFSL